MMGKVKPEWVSLSLVLIAWLGALPWQMCFLWL